MQAGPYRLEPLRVDHAEEMVPVLAPDTLYRFIGGRAPDLDALRDRYRSQVRGRSEDGRQGWLNWIVRDAGSGRAVGYVQATVEHPAHPVAALAWVVTPSAQGRGAASHAAGAIHPPHPAVGLVEFRADIHPANTASGRLARRLGMEPTGELVDGEVVWRSRSRRL